MKRNSSTSAEPVDEAITIALVRPGNGETSPPPGGSRQPHMDGQSSASAGVHRHNTRVTTRVTAATVTRIVSAAAARTTLIQVLRTLPRVDCISRALSRSCSVPPLLAVDNLHRKCSLITPARVDLSHDNHGCREAAPLLLVGVVNPTFVEEPLGGGEAEAGQDPDRLAFQSLAAPNSGLETLPQGPFHAVR